jgi:hypothetical protein
MKRTGKGTGGNGRHAQKMLVFATPGGEAVCMRDELGGASLAQQILFRATGESGFSVSLVQNIEMEPEERTEFTVGEAMTWRAVLNAFERAVKTEARWFLTSYPLALKEDTSGFEPWQIWILAYRLTALPELWRIEDDADICRSRGFDTLWTKFLSDWSDRALSVLVRHLLSRKDPLLSAWRLCNLCSAHGIERGGKAARSFSGMLKAVRLNRRDYVERNKREREERESREQEERALRTARCRERILIAARAGLPLYRNLIRELEELEHENRAAIIREAFRENPRINRMWRQILDRHCRNILLQAWDCRWWHAMPTSAMAQANEQIRKWRGIVTAIAEIRYANGR